MPSAKYRMVRFNIFSVAFRETDEQRDSWKRWLESIANVFF